MQPLCDGGVDQYPQVIDDLEDPWRGQGLSIVVMKGYRDIHMASFNLDLGTRDGTREQPNATCRFHQVLVFFFYSFPFCMLHFINHSVIREL